MYLGDRDESHHVTVTITNEGGDVIFEKEYQLSDSNEADEDATFPASTNPETIVVTVDGTRFERDWPGFEDPALPCDGPNEAGIEIYVENTQDGTPDIRLEADCQSKSTTDTSGPLEFTVKSPALNASSTDNEAATMTRMFTREGANVSPPLRFENIPQDTESLVVVAFDDGMPESPVHWVVWNIPIRDTGETRLPADLDHEKTLTQIDAKQGTNTYGNVGYDGPSSPGASHRMTFNAYAITGRLDVEAGASYESVKRAYEQYDTTSTGFSAVYQPTARTDS